MSSVPAGKRKWKCPECGSESFLSITQLDPIACDACLAKMKNAGKTESITKQVLAGPMGMWQAIPELVKLGLIFAALIGGLLVGFAGGYVVARLTVPHVREVVRDDIGTKSDGETSNNPSSISETEDTRPNPPGYKWNKGRRHKDGTVGQGYWSKDPNYKGDTKK